jgi:hypothetical protein
MKSINMVDFEVVYWFTKVENIENKVVVDL